MFLHVSSSQYAARPRQTRRLEIELPQELESERCLDWDRMSMRAKEHAFQVPNITRASSSVLFSGRCSTRCTNIDSPKDYKCEDGHFPVFASYVTISNPNALSSSETAVNPRRRSWKIASSEWARCQKAIGSINFTKKWRDETLQPRLEFDNFKHRLKSSIFKCIFRAKRLNLRGDDRLFWKREPRPI